MQPAAPLRMPKAAEVIADRLREQIIRGDLQDGDLLSNEPNLAAQLGVSKPTLREALRVLESEGLLQVRNGVRGGPRVTAPNEATVARYVGRYLQYKGVHVDDVLDAVGFIELPAVGLLAQRPRAKDVDQLRRFIDDSERAGEPIDAARGLNAFHRLIVELTRNRTTAVMHGLLEEVVLATDRQIALSYEPSFEPEVKKVHSVHRQVVTLIAAGDGEAATDLWRRHLQAKKRAAEAIRVRESDRQHQVRAV
jgi:DNA-binding FadR family transcriptional regulator